MLEGTRAGTREGTKGGAREGANTDSMLLQTELVGRDSSPTRRSNTSGGSSGGNGGGGNGGGESSGSGAQVTARGPALTPMFKHHTLRCSFGEFVFLNAFVFGYYHQIIYFIYYILSNLTIYSLLHGSSSSISSFLFQDRDNDKSFLSPVGSASARLLTRPRKAKLIWNVSSTSSITRFTDHSAAVKAIAWSPHQHGLLASSGGTADCCIRFWNTLTGEFSFSFSFFVLLIKYFFFYPVYTLVDLTYI